MRTFWFAFAFAFAFAVVLRSFCLALRFAFWFERSSFTPCGWAAKCRIEGARNAGAEKLADGTRRSARATIRLAHVRAPPRLLLPLIVWLSTLVEGGGAREGVGVGLEGRRVVQCVFTVGVLQPRDPLAFRGSNVPRNKECSDHQRGARAVL